MILMQRKMILLLLLMLAIMLYIIDSSNNNNNNNNNNNEKNRYYKQHQPIPSYHVDIQSSSSSKSNSFLKQSSSSSSSSSPSSSSSSSSYKYNEDIDDEVEIMNDYDNIDPLKILCQVNGFRINAAIDTGSRVSTMSASCAQRCRIYNKINVNQNINNRHYDDEKNNNNIMLGTICNVPIELGPALFRTKLYIEKGCSTNNHDFIIGRDLLSLKRNALYMNYRNQNYKIPIVIDGVETSSSFDYDYDNYDDDENIMFASHSWKHTNNNNDKNANGDLQSDRQFIDQLSDNGDLLSMEGV